MPSLWCGRKMSELRATYVTGSGCIASPVVLASHTTTADQLIILSHSRTDDNRILRSTGIDEDAILRHAQNRPT